MMIKHVLLFSALCVATVAVAAPTNKVTGIECMSFHVVNDGAEDRQWAENENEDVSEEILLPVGRTHEVAVKFITGSRQVALTTLYRKSDRSVILEKKDFDITEKCDEQTELGFADEVLEFLDSGVSTENGAFLYGCSATCALPTRPNGMR